jgi:hypothetical protein
VNWAENGVAPDSILAAGGGRTRPLCPFPQTAIYDGIGDPNVASSFHCGGNIETKAGKCEGLLVRYQLETGTQLEPLAGEDEISCGFAFAPITTAALSSSPINGWYRTPTVTLSATDRDSDFDHTEYMIDAAHGWITYTGPFQVTTDGEYLLEYRSVDKGGHVEAIQSLRFKVDATAPVISGMPTAGCTIWPPDNKLVRIAEVTPEDNLSGIAADSLSIKVVSNEPVSTSDIITQDGIVQVRALRLGNGTGRVYSITTQVSDNAGNTASATATCTVPHDQGR